LAIRAGSMALNSCLIKPNQAPPSGSCPIRVTILDVSDKARLLAQAVVVSKVGDAKSAALSPHKENRH